MIAYYAHCKSLYHTPQEMRDVETLESLGWSVRNPSDACWDEGWEKCGMDFKDTIMEGVDVLVFRGLYHGQIPAGVWQEILVAEENCIPVLEFPSRMDMRWMSVSETRGFLREVGQR